MIEKVIEDWHRFIRGDLPGGLDELLADDIVFYSPVVFTPQRGKEVAMLYLNAAGATFGGDDGDETKAASGTAEGKFRYTKQVVAGNHAILEFETTMGDKFVNGVDIITCNDDGKICEFKVMIRPLQAVNRVHQAMGTMLQKMQEQAAS